LDLAARVIIIIYMATVHVVVAGCSNHKLGLHQIFETCHFAPDVLEAIRVSFIA